ncbi:MAG: hypothetical protein LBC71_05370 [Oscillospiraceae bacterium]|jgi:hypothetical protein|nr:hypothetical protein [Oscillospiraceae bacterium]
MKQFPRTNVAGISLPRMLIGTNWLLGWSHKSVPLDNMITRKYNTAESFLPMFEAYLTYGINAIMGPLGNTPVILDALKMASDKFEKEFILIDTPIINVDDTKEGRESAAAIIKRSKEINAKLCLPHHSSVEQLVNKNKGTIERLDDYTSMIRENDLIPGLSAHMPELIVYSDANNYDVETYIQIYNCLGFLMQVEIEAIAGIINKAKKPVMVIKSMAAGRVTPYVALNFVWNTLRDKDMVTLGAYLPDEVHEDVEISFAALERRFPDLEGRSSPNMNQAAFG